MKTIQRQDVRNRVTGLCTRCHRTGAVEVVGLVCACLWTTSSIQLASFSRSGVSLRSIEHRSPPSYAGQGEKGVVRVGLLLSVIKTGLPSRLTGAMWDLLSSAPMVMSPPAMRVSIA